MSDVTRFSTFVEETGEIIDHYDVDVSYGKYFSDPEKAPDTSYATERKRAIMFSRIKNEYEDWRWSEENKIHLICHSQGGNTARYLISLLARGSPLHPEYFRISGRDKWIISMTTLGTPHRGTTVVDVLQNLVQVRLLANHVIPPKFVEINTNPKPQKEEDQIMLLARGFAAIAFQDPKHRPYDLQLDHWGICRLANEPFEKMRKRFEDDSGPVAKWLRSKNNGFYDNSIEGVMLKLNRDAIKTSDHIFYFCLSFHATVPFPTSFPSWTLSAMESFPLSIPILTPLLSALSSLPLVSSFSSLLTRHLSRFAKNLEMGILTKLCTVQNLVKWTTASIATPLLKTAGFTSTTLPAPGKYMPRADVIPPMMPTCYAMSGLNLTPAQFEILGEPKGDWHQNDGIVNTESMKGPDKSVMREIRTFPIEKVGTAEVGDVKGVYWHFGTNHKMDHADEIGVFVDDDTVRFALSPCFNSPSFGSILDCLISEG